MSKYSYYYGDEIKIKFGASESCVYDTTYGAQYLNDSRKGECAVGNDIITLDTTYSLPLAR